ncbi:hypothetical protein Bbelb_314380 [Branchiostoma belcheri]|nr:hypothetical protein Bbelb_314380 [Branchiostoma belcheri]
MSSTTGLEDICRKRSLPAIGCLRSRVHDPLFLSAFPYSKDPQSKLESVSSSKKNSDIALSTGSYDYEFTGTSEGGHVLFGSQAETRCSYAGGHPRSLYFETNAGLQFPEKPVQTYVTSSRAQELSTSCNKNEPKAPLQCHNKPVTAGAAGMTQRSTGGYPSG